MNQENVNTKSGPRPSLQSQIREVFEDLRAGAVQFVNGWIRGGAAENGLMVAALTGLLENTYCESVMKVVPAQNIETLRVAASEVLRILGLEDLPDYGYIYDANEAECCGCERKGPTIERIEHDPDCLTLAMTVLRKAVALTDATAPDSQEVRNVER